MIIVSGGIDIIINHALEKLGISKLVKVVSAKTNYNLNGSINVTMPKNYDPNSIDFKEDQVLYYKTNNYYVFYIGDGSSDFSAVTNADMTFSVQGSELSKFCQEKKILHKDFNNYNEIINYMTK